MTRRRVGDGGTSLTWWRGGEGSIATLMSSRCDWYSSYVVAASAYSGGRCSYSSLKESTITSFIDGALEKEGPGECWWWSHDPKGEPDSPASEEKSSRSGQTFPPLGRREEKSEVARCRYKRRCALAGAGA